MSEKREAATFDSVCRAVESFSNERGWSEYHDPKNLSMLLGSEAGELLAEFRWIANAESDRFAADPKAHQRIRNEIADIGISLILLCQRMGIDLPSAVSDKLEKNAENYPVSEERSSPHRTRNR